MAKIIDGPVGTIFNATTTTPSVALGTSAKTDDGGEVVYCISSGAVSQYALCGINEDFDVYMMTTALSVQSDRLGFPQIAFAAGEYGWVYLRGSNIKVRTKASALADAQLWTTASAGVVDDATAATGAGPRPISRTSDSLFCARVFDLSSCSALS